MSVARPIVKLEGGGAKMGQGVWGEEDALKECVSLLPP